MMKYLKIFLVIILIFCFFGGGFYMYKKPHTVVFIGDSITYYGDNLEEGFIQQLRKQLPDKINIISAGIPGETSDQILARMENDVINNNPEVVYILAGINDICWEPDRTYHVILNNISQMVDNALEHNIKPVILSLTLYTEDFEGEKNIKIDEFNEMLKNFSMEKNIQFIDINTPLKDEIRNRNTEYAVLWEDEIHLNENGNTIVKNVILNEFMKKYKYRWFIL